MFRLFWGQEFFAARVLWRALFDRISVLDETAMCTQRLRLQVPGMKITEAEKYGFVEKHMLDLKKLQYQSDSYDCMCKVYLPVEH